MMSDQADQTTEKIKLAITTKNCIESFLIDGPFTGEVYARFNQGGLTAVEKRENIRKVEKLK
jgi:hypothetical protein